MMGNLNNVRKLWIPGSQLEQTHHTITQCRHTSCLQLAFIWLACICTDQAVPMLYSLFNILNATSGSKNYSSGSKMLLGDIHTVT